MVDSARPSKTARTLKRRGPRPLALEPRIMYDGAAIDTAAAGDERIAQRIDRLADRCEDSHAGDDHAVARHGSSHVLRAAKPPSSMACVRSPRASASTRSAG